MRMAWLNYDELRIYIITLKSGGEGKYNTQKMLGQTDRQTW